MIVFLISQGQDIGGQNARTVRAFRKHAPKWNVRAMHVGRTYIQYPYDLEWDVTKARELYAAADVVHHQNRLYGYAMHDRGANKPSVVTHHGPPLRGNADAMNREARSIGAVQTVSTVDLLDDAPHATWTPNFYDIDDLRRRYPVRNGGKKLRIGHAPTVREAKGTKEILYALNRLSMRYEIEIDLTEHVTWSASLTKKARCDIYVDQVTLGYGLSTIECMALGVPVVSGWSSNKDRALFEKHAGEVPFVHSTAAQLEDRIEELIRAPELRAAVVDRQMEFVRQWHDDKRGVAQMIEVYESAQPTYGVDALELFGDVPKEQVVRKWAA